MRSFWNAAVSAKPLAAYLGSVVILGTLATVSLAVLCRQVIKALPEKSYDYLTYEPRSRVAQARMFHRQAEARRKARTEAEANEAKPNGWPSRFAEVRGLFEPSFGVTAGEPDESIPQQRDVTARGAQSVVSYRTVCVRLCDGSFTPMSFATTPTFLRADQEKCEIGAAIPSRLYVAPNPGATLEVMTDMDGRPYAELATAFRFRTTYDPSCRPSAPETERVVAEAGARPAKVTAAQPVAAGTVAKAITRAPEISEPEVEMTVVAEAPPSTTPVESVLPGGVVDARTYTRTYTRTATRSSVPRPMRLSTSEPEDYDDVWYEAGNKKFNGRDWRLSAYQHY